MTFIELCEKSPDVQYLTSRRYINEHVIMKPARFEPINKRRLTNLNLSDDALNELLLKRYIKYLSIIYIINEFLNRLIRENYTPFGYSIVESHPGDWLSASLCLCSTVFSTNKNLKPKFQNSSLDLSFDFEDLLLDDSVVDIANAKIDATIEFIGPSHLQRLSKFNITLATLPEIKKYICSLIGAIALDDKELTAGYNADGTKI